MYPHALDVWRCPSCRGALALHAETRDGEDVLTGWLDCAACSARYPIANGIPRFVPPENYSTNFGFQWNRFAELQVDSVQHNTTSRDRFFLQAGIGPGDLKDKRVLEAGCGGGRFSEIALESGAELFAVDLSNAVDKNRSLHRGHPRLHLAQASILSLPVPPEAFDLVFCFGVLQHTPSPSASFRALAPLVRRGGRLAVDVYAAHPKQVLHLKYALRPFTRSLSDEQLLAAIERWAPSLLAFAERLRRVPRIGRALTRIVPLKIHDGIMDHEPAAERLPLAVLETFDALSPAYDRPRPRWLVQRWFERAGFVGVETRSIRNGLNYGSGVKPS